MSDLIVVEYSKSNRSKCRFCRKPILQGEMRVGMKVFEITFLHF